MENSFGRQSGGHVIVQVPRGRPRGGRGLDLSRVGVLQSKYNERRKGQRSRRHMQGRNHTDGSWNLVIFFFHSTKHLVVLFIKYVEPNNLVFVT